MTTAQAVIKKANKIFYGVSLNGTTAPRRQGAYPDSCNIRVGAGIIEMDERVALRFLVEILAGQGHVYHDVECDHLYHNGMFRGMWRDRSTCADDRNGISGDSCGETLRKRQSTPCLGSGGREC